MMKNVIVAWVNSNENDFESTVPLKFLGERDIKLGFSNNINILFLDGYEKLSEAYKKNLINLGYSLFDLSYLYSEFDKKYTQLNRFSDYEKKCFLRWLVIEKFFSGEKIIHYDGDIVFNEDPAVINKLVQDKTFVLQGCPAFTVISNLDWFNFYKNELNLFVKDIDKYSQNAWQERTGWDITFKTRWAGSRFRNIISSDQDFISHLIHTGKIIQDSIENILFNFQDYILFENPLFIHVYDENFPYKYFRKNNIDYFSYVRHDTQGLICKKKVLFWHMQSCFNFYLSKFILRKKILKFLLFSQLNEPITSNGWEGFLNKKLGKFFNHAIFKRAGFNFTSFNHTSRAFVYDYFFNKKDFSGIFKDRIWWKKGVFY